MVWCLEFCQRSAVLFQCWPTFLQEQNKSASNNKMFLGGLKEQVTEQDIQTFFSQFGPLEKIETFTDKETGRRKGFAFITFTDFDAADKCFCKYKISDRNLSFRTGICEWCVILIALLLLLVHISTLPFNKVNIQGVKIEVKKARAPTPNMNRQQGQNWNQQQGYIHYTLHLSFSKYCVLFYIVWHFQKYCSYFVATTRDMGAGLTKATKVKF